MDEQTQRRKPGRPRVERTEPVDAVIANALTLDDITREDIQQVEAALGCASSFWGGIDPRRIVLAVRNIYCSRSY